MCFLLHEAEDKKWPANGTGLGIEFRVFVEAAERQLYVLFKSIDHDKNGKIDKEELHHAVQRAGLAVPMRRLDALFENIDHNRDGYITYEEWRLVPLQFIRSPTCRDFLRD